MNLLWDLRLFSHRYATRGIGRYATLVTAAILDTHQSINLAVWGNRDHVPEHIRKHASFWIDYTGGNWKSSLYTMLYYALFHKTDIIHYWAACAPIPALGMSFTPRTPAVATLYDAGAALWDLPFCRHIRTTPYWKMQKLLLARTSGIVAISPSTLREFSAIVPLHKKKTRIVYPPLSLPDAKNTSVNRAPYFITLGGSPHKNCSRVIHAFSTFRETFPDHTLRILGNIDQQSENILPLPDGVIHEPDMNSYEQHLATCSGLLFCSWYEGLGLPPLEASRYGCPLLLSSIPPLIDTCGGFGRFVDPYDTLDIAAGIKDLALQQSYWHEKSLDCGKHYAALSANAGNICLELYTSILQRSPQT